jgi:peroxiredoxin family protein
MAQETQSPAELEARVKELTERLDELESHNDRLCLGVMRGDLDYTIATFIIACGAAAYDMEVDIFFTFWGTAALRDPKKRVKKNLLERMFGIMLPSGTKKLPLSKMQMGGMGQKMIKGVMKAHNAKSLEELMEEAGKMGVRIHVCTMSMELMGIKKEELIDYPHLDYVGVGAFVGMFSEAKQCWFM